MEGWSSKTVEQLKIELRSRGLPISGKKSELVRRLEETEDSRGIIEAEIIETIDGGGLSGFRNRLLKTTALTESRRTKKALLLAAIIFSGATGGGLIFGGGIASWFSGNEDYELVDFNASKSRDYAQGLVDLGDPVWGGRLSGTVEEENTAQSIKTNFSNSGIPSILDEFEVPLYYMGSQFDLMICQPGSIGGIIGGPTPCSLADINREETEFLHTQDYVVQGYSGSVNIPASSNTLVVDLGMGNESEDWASAGNAIGLVWMLEGLDGGPGTESNTVLMQRAQLNSLRGLIIINSKQNCDELIQGDCVPYSKSLDITQFSEKPYNIGFVMVSKSVGELISDQVVNGGSMLQFQVDVDNQQEGYIHVPCGIIEGSSDALIIVGAHHDTVYNGQGAVDNTAGTATVMEMARQMALIESELGEPEATIYFCTWGGEEEGLWGSREWVKKYQSELQENLRLYINLDMNHVDSERNSGLILQGNSQEDVRHLEGIVEKFSEEHSNLAEKYQITIRHLDSEEMPYNSDHAPFVYDVHPDEGDDRRFGKAMLCYGSGSSEYHTFLDNMDRFNEESLAVSGIIYGSLVRHLAWG